MDINKLYETLTGEPYPHKPEGMVEASWALSSRAGALGGLSTAAANAPKRTSARSRAEPLPPS